MDVIVVKSAALVGIDAFPVDVEVTQTRALPGIRTVGLPDAALKESEARVQLALRNQGLLEHRPCAVVNLAPAEMRKTGTSYELPMAAGLLALEERVPADALRGLLVVGELGLRGDVRPIRGVLSVALLARALGARAVVVPQGNAGEAALVEGLAVYPVGSLRELAEGLRGEPPFVARPAEASTVPAGEAEPALVPDFAEVRGQGEARRAAEIAAAGGHNLLLVGPPGSGKTMIARRIPFVLPALEPDEAVETTRIHSAAGLLRGADRLIRHRPFRAPHHTISAAGLIGGYFPPRPGELSLAHNGVLFLDEMGEFSRSSLEALREPLEDGSVRLSRGGLAVSFPARSMLVAATNPCPCGYHGDRKRQCRCPDPVVQRYRRRLSGPLLDRIDLQTEVPRLTLDELVACEPGDPSAVVAGRVAAARHRQARRLGKLRVRTNAEMPDRAVRELVPLPRAARPAIEGAISRLGLSPRGFVRILRIARTLADLAGEQEVEAGHVLEALQYRALDWSVACAT